MAKLKNKKHEILVQEYLIDLNQTQAAIRAGYSPKTATVQAHEIFTKPYVRARVEELLAERAKRTGVNQDRIIRELARVAFVNAAEVVSMKDAMLLEDASEDDTAAIASVKVKVMSGDVEGVEREVRFSDKLKALELLGKHLGMFTDKFQISGGLPIQVVIEDDYGDDPDGEG